MEWRLDKLQNQHPSDQSALYTAVSARRKSTAVDISGLVKNKEPVFHPHDLYSPGLGRQLRDFSRDSPRALGKSF